VPTEVATIRDSVQADDTVLVGRHGFYVRLRGYLHAEDRVVFDCWTEKLLDPFTSTLRHGYNYDGK